uniref:Chaperonin containing TCP1 subunit 2 n=1 Tax=Molossus molossus TaxID=27622 RepID=A0A7J8FW73_MOLMO|nr:chaperonin containing TCP1 subunit 2 [Molossus molossus]
MASLSLAPVNIFKAGADEERAETARLSSFIGAIAIGDLVKSTLGPKGMDKILLSSGRDASLMVTNDGATILKNIGVDNPAAKVLVDMSRVQDDEVGDGTTSVTVLAAERSLHDALCVLAQTVKDSRTVYGGGCSEMLMAHAVTQLASKTPGKEAVAMESYAKALRMLPTIIADNAGYDSADLVAQLRAAHSEGKTTSGLDMKEGTIGDMAILGITESFQVKRQVLLSAAEAAEVILRVDNIIKAAPRKRVPDHHPC